jgi:GntR family transcriptional regulator
MLDKKSPVPLYLQLAEKLRYMRVIRPRETHRALPSENEWCERYAISRRTVREALRILDREGLIERQRGLGTFIASSKIVHESSKVMSFSRVMSAIGKKPRDAWPPLPVPR